VTKGLINLTLSDKLGEEKYLPLIGARVTRLDEFFGENNLLWAIFSLRK
jgi:hypothetical protein